MLAQWNPFTPRSITRSSTKVPVFDELIREADRLLDGATMYPSGWSNIGVPTADIYETQDQLVLKIDVPGFDPKSLNIQVEGDVLTVQAQRAEEHAQKGQWLRQERTLEHVARSFVLPHTVDAGKCEARCEHGVLTLTLPKREEAKPRSISVKVES